MYVSLFAAAAEAMRRILAGLVNGLLKDFLSSHGRPALVRGVWCLGRDAKLLAFEQT
jgi:hypothetical protein